MESVTAPAKRIIGLARVAIDVATVVWGIAAVLFALVSTIGLWITNPEHVGALASALLASVGLGSIALIALRQEILKNVDKLDALVSMPEQLAAQAAGAASDPMAALGQGTIQAGGPAHLPGRDLAQTFTTSMIDSILTPIRLVVIAVPVVSGLTSLFLLFTGHGTSGGIAAFSSMLSTVVGTLPYYAVRQFIDKQLDKIGDQVERAVLTNVAARAAPVIGQYQSMGQKTLQNKALAGVDRLVKAGPLP